MGLGVAGRGGAGVPDGVERFGIRSMNNFVSQQCSALPTDNELRRARDS